MAWLAAEPGPQKPCGGWHATLCLYLIEEEWEGGGGSSHFQFHGIPEKLTDRNKHINTGQQETKDGRGLWVLPNPLKLCQTGRPSSPPPAEEGSELRVA